MRSAPLTFLVLVAIAALVALGLLAGGAPARAATTPAGDPLQVNAATFSAHPSVAASPGGDLFVVWSSNALDPLHGVFGRRLSPAGVPIGPEIALADLTASRTRVSPLPGGGYLASWLDSVSLLRVRRCDAGGQPIGAAVVIPADPPFSAYTVDYDLVPLPAGGFVAVWTYVGILEDSPDFLAAQLLDAEGTPRNVPTSIGQIVDRSHGGHPRVAADPGGGFAVVWQDAGNSPGSVEIFAQRFDATGTAREAQPFRVSDPAPGTRSSPLAQYSPDGKLGVVWLSSGGPSPAADGIFVQRFDAAGARLGGALHLQNGFVAAQPFETAADAGGNILLLWNGPGGIDTLSLFGRQLDPSWHAVGDPFVIGAVVVVLTAETVAAFIPGGFEVVTARSQGMGSDQGGLGSNLYAQRFAADCVAGSASLCLHGGFHLAVAWRDPRTGAEGDGTAVPLTDDTGAFWFFAPANLELMVKVLDGHAVNGHFWVFYGALSDVEYTLTVTDTATGAAREYHNPPFTLASHADTLAFP